MCLTALFICRLACVLGVHLVLLFCSDSGSAAGSAAAVGVATGSGVAPRPYGEARGEYLGEMDTGEADLGGVQNRSGTLSEEKANEFRAVFVLVRDSSAGAVLCLLLRVALPLLLMTQPVFLAAGLLVSGDGTMAGVVINGEARLRLGRHRVRLAVELER